MLSYQDPSFYYGGQQRRNFEIYLAHLSSVVLQKNWVI